MVEDVLATPGDSVRAGQALLVLESDAARLAGIASYSAMVSAATAARDYASSRLARTRELHASGAASDIELEAAEAGERTAIAGLSQALAGLGSARAGGADGLVCAPFDGVVTRVWAEEGCPASGSLVSISGSGALEADLRLPPSRLQSLAEGLTAVFESPVHPGLLFEGSVVAAASCVDPMSGLVHARATFPDPDGILRPGISGTVTVVLRTVDSCVVVHGSALIMTPDGGMQAAVVEDGRARLVPVVTGVRNGFRFEVVSGLRPGDSLITAGAGMVSEGCRVAGAGG
jgi:membrane fusion protein (multidrug efflux system)